MAVKKILLVGFWKYVIYEISFFYALKKRGHSVKKINGLNFLSNKWKEVSFISEGHVKLNNHIIETAKQNQFDFIFFWRPIYVFPSTLKKLRQLRIKLYSYNNDDPFNANLKLLKTRILHYLIYRYYKKGLRYYDINFFYREINLIESKKFKSNSSDLIFPYFIKERAKKFKKIKDKKNDVIFIGHFEHDNRDDHIKILIENKINVEIYGNYWEYSKLYLNTKNIDNYKKYNQEINNSKISLCFFSKHNRDEYTRRVFEITSNGSLLMSENTKFMRDYFTEWENVVFFNNPEELLFKTIFLLKNHDLIEKISKNGQKLVLNSEFELSKVVDKFLLRSSSK